MRQISSYKNFSEASNSLDNGGRFYNVLTKSNDGTISQAELGKVAGRFTDKQKMVLFFDLATSALAIEEKKELISQLDDALKSAYKKHKTVAMSVSEANTTTAIGSNIIVNGIPTLIDAKSDFTGLIMVPISTGNATTFVMLPIVDTYDVYEIRDEASSDTFLIAHARGKQKLPHKKVKVAGIIKELKAKKEEENGSKRFLEVLYFLEEV